MDAWVPRVFSTWPTWPPGLCTGVPREAAAIVADYLFTANLSGMDSHGVLRLEHYVRRLENGTIKTQPHLTFERVAHSLGIMEGVDGLGHVVTYHACTRA